MVSNLDPFNQLRRKMGKCSILDFAKTYFPQYLKCQPAVFHEEICSILQSMSEKRDIRFALAAPRGHAKSTLVTLFYVVWSICYDKEECILILSATARQSEGLLSDVSAALDNQLLRDDFPEVFNPDVPAKSKWTQAEIVLPNNFMVAARSAEQELRGIKHEENRPSLIILDDVDGDKNTYSADRREKVSNWFKSTVLNVKCSNGANFIAVGTLLHPDSLLSRLTGKKEYPNWEKRVYQAVRRFSERKDLWQTWSNILFSRGEMYNDAAGYEAANQFFVDNKQAMLEGTEVLWEECEDYYALMKIREIEGSFSFDSEKQNDPTNIQDCRYNPDKFSYWDQDGRTVDELLASFQGDYTIIGACDPSVGTMKVGADPWAIVILAKHKGKLYVLDAEIKPHPQDQLIEAVLSFCKIRKPMSKFVIESNLFPQLLLKNIRERAYQENIIAPFKERRNSSNKELRIFGMETHITTGQIVFSVRHTELLEQLKYYPRGDHDDGPDALEMALREAELNEKGFLPLTEKRDSHGRTADDPDAGRTTPEEDARDPDDDDTGGGSIGIVSLT